ncbi:MAG: hypothetical protein ACI8PB_002301 [Desulforhopalus sp.]|jgi:hypothetical protein
MNDIRKLVIIPMLYDIQLESGGFAGIRPIAIPLFE